MTKAIEHGKLLARLQALTDAAGTNYYERISIAYQLMQDKTWLLSQFGGDDYKGDEFLEARYFHDLSGSMTIWMLLTIYHKFPGEDAWKKAKYNLRTLYAQCKPPPAEKNQSRRKVKVAEFERVQQEAKEARFEVKQVKKELETKEDELTKLRREVQQLRQENATLKGQVLELEKIVRGKLAG